MAGLNINDIAGLGEIIGHLKEFLLGLVEMWTTREERKLKNQSLRLRNMREFLRIAMEYNLTPEQIKYYEILVCSLQDIQIDPTQPQSLKKDIGKSSSTNTSQHLKIHRRA